MEKIPIDKHNSFTKNGQIPSPRNLQSSSFNDSSDQPSGHDARDNNEDVVSDHAQVSDDIAQFTSALSAIDDKSSPPEIPDAVETFSEIIESRIAKYKSGEIQRKFGRLTEEDTFFIEAVKRISKLTNAFSEFPASNSSTSTSLNRTSNVLQRAMAFLEEEFRSLLEDSKNHPNFRTFSKNSSFKAIQEEPSDHCKLEREPDSNESDELYLYPVEVMTKMKAIAETMVFSGYESECCQVYSISRRNAFKEEIKRLEFEKINVDDVLKMSWESLESDIAKWIKVVKTCSNSLFPGEKKLVEFVFFGYPLISRSLFSNLARAVVIQLLDFAEAVSMTKRSAEKLFKFLDMYETLQNLIPAITYSDSDESEHELKSEIAAAANRLGEAAVSIFCDLENSIKSDVAKSPVPGGAVHPLTRYVMNYLKYACEYKSTLEEVFEKHANLEKSLPVPNKISTVEVEGESDSPHNSDSMANATPFSIQVLTIMDLLDSNLEAKSKLYRDLSLRHVFLMNNGRYILQKVKGSNEILQVIGDTWCRKRSTVVRRFHKNYQRETWGKVLQILSHEGLMQNGKVNKPLLKERFKQFNTTIDEIHRNQSTWVVSDEQLQSELRVSISAVMIPAYRSFLARFRQTFDSGRQSEKYIKYQPEDIETMIEDLFEGNPNSMAKRRT